MKISIKSLVKFAYQIRQLRSLYSTAMYCEVTVEQGSIKGKILKAFDGTKYYSFEGIPYAKPPVGELRFKNPQPPDSWSGVKDCTKPGNKCAQLNPISSKGFQGSEDCLYLNVYTPMLPAEKLEKLPVLFFIHGGRLLVGYGDYYQPDYFMRHDVILVTINYRLNILGFLSLDIPEAPGNVGMKDCVYALRWVKKNISNFNGDSTNVTLFGESAGAAIASAFLTSDMTVGLFDKLIAQSGNHVADVFFCVQDHVGVASHVTSLLGKELKEKRSIYDFLMKVPVEDLVSVCMSVEMEKHPYILNPVFMAVIEKEFEGLERFMTEQPRECMRWNRFQKVPVLAGSNVYEGAAFLRRDDGEIFYDDNLTFAIPRCLYLQESSPESKKVTSAIKNYYFGRKKFNEVTNVEYVKFISETLMQRDILYFTELVSKYNDRVYFYNFHYEGSLNIDVMKNLGIKGTTHGDLIQYQFYRESKAKKCTERDIKIIDFLSETWCNFAKFGKPTCRNQSIEWLPYTQKDRLTLIIDDENKLVENTDYPACKFWQDLCEGRAKL